MVFPSFTVSGIRFISPYVTENLSYVARFPSSEPMWLVSLAVSSLLSSWTWRIETWGPSVSRQWESGDEAFSTKEEAASAGLTRLSSVLLSAFKEVSNDRNQ